MRFSNEGARDRAMSRWLDGVQQVLEQHGHQATSDAARADVALYHADTSAPRSYRRRGRGVFVITFAHVPNGGTIDELYPLLVRTLSNLLIVIPDTEQPAVQMITPEKGHFRVQAAAFGNELFERIYERIEPLATARMVIENIFQPDLPEALRHGDEHTASIARAGQTLAQMNLMPAPFPLEDILSPSELRFLKKSYGIGGLSYGNFSERLDTERFWMSASGVDKSKMRDIGRDMLLVTAYEPERNAMVLSVPPDVEPRRVSVDAIEHWLIYRENPGVGAILHVHCWLDGAPCTELQYPCGTYELGRAVADLVRNSPDPNRAVVGLKNHGLTITGATLDEILARVGKDLVSTVPMS